MLSALKLSGLGAALALLGSAAVAGEAPAAYYPSLGYGQSPPIYEVAPGGYVDEPPYFDGPPDGYVGEPAHGPIGPGPCHCGPPPPPPPPPCHCVTPPGPPDEYELRFHAHVELGELVDAISQGARRCRDLHGPDQYAAQWLKHPFPALQLDALERWAIAPRSAQRYEFE